ncbi:MAG TPA: SGNH family hydrolase [Beijerinckiaceae bacterium]|nr:SGNH family hydrolase [Beijerinckiaceae bacterium]
MLTALLVLVVVWSGAIGEALAQGDGSSVYTTAPKGRNDRGPLDWLFGRRGGSVTPVIPQAAPRADSKPRTYRPARRTTPSTLPTVPGDPAAPADTNAPSVAGDPAAPAPAPPPALPPVSVVVAGDSLSVFLGQGLQELYAEKPHVSFVKRHRDASGLVRDDFHDWPKAFRDLAAGARPDALVLMIGSNDRQQLRDDQGVHEPLTPRWKELYAKRIDDVVAAIRGQGIPLIWVGLPVMRSEKYSVDLTALNDLYRARAQAAGIAFVEIWEAFAGEDGHYTVNGPDVGGEIVRLRTSDGVHFTKAGARKLAFFVDQELAKLLGAIKPQPPLPQQPATPQVDPGDLPPPPQVMAPPGPERFPAPASPSFDAMLGVPMPEIAAAPTLVPRPAQGPVMPLNAAPLTTGGQLLSAQTVNRLDEARKVFVQGVGAPPKPGRLDDFRPPEP